MYLLSLLLGVHVNCTDWLSSLTLSSLPTSVTHCATDQSDGLKVNVAGLALTSVESLSETVTVTLSVGSLLNTTLTLSLTLPFSLTNALLFDNTRPTVSLSLVVTVSVCTLTPP